MHAARLLGKDERRPPVDALWSWQEPSVASPPDEVCKNLPHVGIGRPALALINVIDIRHLVLDWFDVPQLVLIEKFLESSEVIQKHADHLAIPWVRILWFQLPPIMKEPVPLNLNDSVPVFVHEPHSR